MRLRTLPRGLAVLVTIAGFETSSQAGEKASAAPGLRSAARASANPVRTHVFESEPFVIDRIYKSMKGPRGVERIAIGDPRANELIWVLAYETEIIDTRNGQAVSAEYMCHNNGDFPDLKRHRRLIGADPIRSVNRIFTLSQGVMKVEFPDGFGIPIRSGEPLLVHTQVLNLNPIEERLEVRYRTTVRYVAQSELVREVKSLYQFGVMGLKALDGAPLYPRVAEPDPSVHGESCSVGEVVDGGREFEISGENFTNHWIVEPGREENHTLVTARLGLWEDTTVHYIAVHLHPFAESLELRDLTTQETVFKAKATNRKDRIGLEHVESYSSSEGKKLFKDHEYTLISVYQNDSGVAQDAMASMFLYLADKAFDAAH